MDLICRELDAWHRAGRRAAFWWRDDDAVKGTPELHRLLALARKVKTSLALAVIPDEADVGLRSMIRNQPCVAWQHGFRHKWCFDEEGAVYAHGEFGAERTLESMMADAVAGWRAMDRVFEDEWEPVFVPPFHALTKEFKTVLPSLGYRGLSSGLPFVEPIPTLAEVSADVDIMDWPNRCFIGNAAATDLIVSNLRSRRTRGIENVPVGILTHHLAMDEGAWDFCEALFPLFAHHPAAELVPADRIFERFAPPATRELIGCEPRCENGEDITVVITSCGRQDLLDRTLESFLRFNTCEVREIMVIEDGDGTRNRFLADKYCKHRVRWYDTGIRVGQIAAIDRAYNQVQTEYVFHCEDDWEFLASGFMEKSKTLLESNQSILQVWLRGLNDTNRHPLIAFPLYCGDFKYQLLRHHHDAGEWGTWHGLSWNPGLRRMSDYHALGSFSALDPERNMETWRVECEAGAFYQQRGMYAAIITDQGNDGYVRHIGQGRRVARDYLPHNS